METEATNALAIILIVFSIYLVIYIILDIIKDKKREHLEELQEIKISLMREIVLNLKDIKQVLELKSKIVDSDPYVTENIKSTGDISILNKTKEQLLEEYDRIQDKKNSKSQHKSLRTHTKPYS